MFTSAHTAKGSWDCICERNSFVVRLASCRFVAYLDDAAPSEAEIIVWSEHHIADGDEVQMLNILYLITGILWSAILQKH